MANEKRLIDANALMDAFRKYMVDRHDKIKCASEEYCKVCDRPCLWRRVVSDAPTVDAVEVMRCKDCVSYEEQCPSFGYCYHWDYEQGMSPNQVYGYDFCSYGERKDNDL